MNIVELINKKKEQKKLTSEEIEFLVTNYTRGKIPDYQFSAFLMAVRLNGLTLEETVSLTSSMIHTGKLLDLSFLSKPSIDKHSTGGVGDKISLILAPLVASCGVCVPMISGRGLGHTGGTLDKLESIPGFRTSLNREEMYQALKQVGCFISGQTAEIAPADKKIYALRDVTGTVDSIPLITASIMSKKIAEGIDGLVLDTKYGKGAFIKTKTDAITLCSWMIKTGKKMGKRVVSLITNMDQPIGRMVGNSLEMWEAIEMLKGRYESDLKDLVFALGSKMLLLANRVKTEREAAKLLYANLCSGKAWQKFRDMVAFQGGKCQVLQNKNHFLKVKHKYEMGSEKSGFVAKIDAYKLGMAAVELGAGRRQIGDRIDPFVGFEVLSKIGNRVDKNQVLMVVYSNKMLGSDYLDRLKEIFLVSQNKVVPPVLIAKFIE